MDRDYSNELRISDNIARCIILHDGTVEWGNIAFFNLAGLPVGSRPSFFSLFYKPDVQMLISGKMPVKIFELTRPDKTIRHVIAISSQMQSDGCHVAMFDISGVESIESMEHSNFRISTLLSKISGSICLFEIGPKMRAIYANNSFFNMTHYTKEDFETYRVDVLAPVHYDDREPLLKNVRDSLADDDIMDISYRIESKCGGLGWRHMRASRIPYPKSPYPVILAVINDVTEKKMLESKLALNEETLKMTFEQTNSAIWEYDIVNSSITQSEKARQNFAGGLEVIYDVPRSLFEMGIIYPDDEKKVLALYNNIRGGEPRASCEFRTKLISGNFSWVRITYTTVIYEGDIPVKAVGIIEDISDIMDARENFEREIQYRAAITSRAKASFDIDLTNDTFIRCDDALMSSLNLLPTIKYSDFLELAAHKLVSPEYINFILSALCKDTLISAYKTGVHEFELEFICLSRDRKQVWVKIVVHLIARKGSDHVLASAYAYDIDDEKRKQLLLQDLATRDFLTGLYNRSAIEKIINQQIKSKEDKKLCLFMIDLDNFKELNDTFGHVHGDKVLLDISKKLLDSFRKGDHVARLGGDEFCVVLSDIKSDEFIRECALRICKALKHSYTYEGKTIETACSIGIAFAPDHFPDFHSLYSCADEAMYKAKHMGKNTYAIYGEDCNNSPPPSIPCEWLLEEIDELACIIDVETHETCYINRSGKEKLGLTDGSIGEKCYEAIHGFNSPCSFCHNDKLCFDYIYSCDYYNPKVDRHYSVKNKLIMIGGRLMRLALMLDVTDRGLGAN